MYKRISVIVASTSFALLVLLAIIVTDLYDRDYPLAIGVESKIHLNFRESGFSVTEAYQMLEKLDAYWNLGLLKVAPDHADVGRHVFVTLNEDHELPDEFQWFRGVDSGEIVGKEYLLHSYPDGFYLVTGNKKRLDEFVFVLSKEGVEVAREDASILESFIFVIQERGFAAAVIASLTMMTSLALFWLTSKARSRALRVLGGASTVSIQLQDLTGFASSLFKSAGIILLAGCGYVGLSHGGMFVGVFFQVLVILQLTVIVISLILACVMSMTAWPHAEMLAYRRPAVKSLRRTAIILQVITFLLVISAVEPAWSAYKHSKAMADDMEQWKRLADQVAIEFGTTGGEMELLESRLGALIAEAESLDSVALSYTYTPEMWPGVDFGEYSSISFVNKRWIELMSPTPFELKSIPLESLPKEIVSEVREEMELLSRDGMSAELFAQVQFYRPEEQFNMPISSGGGGERLLFENHVLLVVLPSLYGFYNDASLTSMISSSNITFTGVAPTQQLLKNHGLDGSALRQQEMDGELRVVYIAEEGILLAQYAAYVVWLLNLALFVLIMAFTVAAGISASITAILHAKRDFPLRLSGASWIAILKQRIVKEWAVGVILVTFVYFLQQPEALGTIVVAVTYGFVVVPLSHLVAAKWCFKRVIRRSI